MFIFPVQLTTSRIGNLIRLIHTLLYVMTIHTYIHTVDPMLLLKPWGNNPAKCRKEVLPWNPMFPPKRFDTPPPVWGMLRRFRCVQIFLLNLWCSGMVINNSSVEYNRGFLPGNRLLAPLCDYVLSVFFPFILDINFVGRTSRGHTGVRSHRIFHPPSFCGACLSFSRENDSAIPFPRRP